VDSPQVTKDRIANVTELFHSNNEVRRPDDSKLVQYIYTGHRVVHPLSPNALEMLHTRYHTVPKLEVLAPLSVKW
jgi:Iron hydrogenase small subunit